MKKIGLVFFALLMFSQASATDNRYKDTLLKSIKGTGFNGVLLLSQKGKVLLHENIGFADKDKQMPINDEHLFSPGSVGKEFTTVSIMQLVADKKLRYYDKISHFITGLPKGSENITVEHILTHTSGLPRIKWKKNIQTSEVIEQIKNSKIQFEPGRGYLYSNLNVILRALLVEKITEKPYIDFLNKSIFKIASMNASYQQETKGKESKNKVYGDYPTYLKGVSIYVTPEDLLKFENALNKGQLVDFAEIERFLPGDKLSGKDNRAYFDFGRYYTSEEGKLKYWEHDGSNPNHHTLKHHNFEQDYTIILMSSDGNKSTLYEIRNNIVKLLSSK
ncbi:serine hydrolase [Pleionea sp. CnH1-48]|uniref:serine hydrolase domain-containing protein n=1 Tax=Pleionea sp. CnH1-48 TaxID=2954494 RepID=UPI002096E8F5|nr:serine hydrolase domain-containing protein [Pleionea sp. CnH1-48]MCO7224366.1 beta-lactamase family protein [Pleionea sp. CnH1-48]